MKQCVEHKPMSNDKQTNSKVTVTFPPVRKSNPKAYYYNSCHQYCNTDNEKLKQHNNDYFRHYIIRVEHMFINECFNLSCCFFLMEISTLENIKCPRE